MAALGTAATTVAYSATATALTGNGQSYLTASPSSVSIDLNGGTNPVAVSVALDSKCPNALVTGHSYNIGAVVADTTVATLDKDSAGPLNCSSGAANPTASFNVEGLACGSTSVTLTPVVNPNGNSDNAAPGIQRKVNPVSVPVTVTDSASVDPACGGGTPGGGGANPAAPAVANMYLNGSKAADQVVWNACQAADGGNKNWRGDLVSYIAAWMPTPESVKDDTSVFPNPDPTTGGDDWTLYVEQEVNNLCGLAIDEGFPAPANLPPYATTPGF